MLSIWYNRTIKWKGALFHRMNDHFAWLIKTINEAIEKKCNAELSVHNITFSQIKIIMALYHSEKQAYSLKELEKLFHCSQATMAGTVARLENKGLVKRCSLPGDKRIKSIELTTAGKELAEKACTKLTDLENWLTKMLSPSEKQELKRLLEIIHDSILNSKV